MLVVRLMKGKSGYKTINLKYIAHTVRAMAIEDGLISYARIFQRDREVCTMIVQTELPGFLLQHKFENYCPFVEWLAE